MRKLLFVVACCALLAAPVLAQTDPPAQLRHAVENDGSYEGGWVVGFPTGSSDYFNQRWDVVGVIVAGVSVGSADFGAGLSYPTAGLFDPNFTVDSLGNTPDLSSGVTTGAIPGGGAVYNVVYGAFGGNASVSGNKHIAVQLPPGDSGLLGVGADSNNPDPATFDGWTNTGYSTPSNDFSATANWGFNLERDMIAENIALGGFNSSFALFTDNSDELGDFITATTQAGADFGAIYQTSAGAGALWMVWISFSGLPVTPASPVIPSIPSGGGSYLRVGTTWPLGAGGLTINFVAIGAVPGVIGSVHTSNEVTVFSLPDPSCTWGIRDDGTYESGWVVSIPAGSSDYFNNLLNQGAPPTTVTDMAVAVMDFGTTASSYPSSGLFGPNYTVDSSGWTPDLTADNGTNGPFTFPAGSFETTSGLMSHRAISVAYAAYGTADVHGVIQFPPGDSGLLGVGGDTTGSFSCTWGAAWTLDGYSSPSNRFDTTAGWGIRMSGI